MALKPETATRLRNGEREEVAINSLRHGDVIEVAAGGRLPADGKLVSRFASFDESALTGESIRLNAPPARKSRQVPPAWTVWLRWKCSRTGRQRH